MTPDQAIVASAVHSWKQNVERADKVFSGLTEQQLLTEVAPGRNRLVYLWGHLTAVHDGMLPLLGLGDRLASGIGRGLFEGPIRRPAFCPSAARSRDTGSE